MTRTLRKAVALSFILNLFLIVLVRYRLSYDAYTHMFFADHYRRDWWSLWDPRWFGGFEVVSYPPLVHQLIAFLSAAIGIEAAFALVLLLVLTALPLTVFAFSRIFSGPATAGYAALASAVLPSIYLSAHTFGQLPTLAALVFSLWGLAVLAAYLREGRPGDGALALALAAATAAAHHATLLFLFAGALAVAGQAWLAAKVPLRSLLPRLAGIGLLATIAVLGVIWPFWRWGLGQSLQTPIDHLSRHDYLTEPFAQLAFFWPIYGLFLSAIPWAVRGLWSRERFFPAALFFLLFFLGLGGTTPLPRLLFGAGWAWLTYDRFALWASLLLLPFFGEMFIVVRRWLPRRLEGFRVLVAFSTRARRRLWRARFQPRPATIRRSLTRGAFSALGLVALFVGLAQTLMHTEPDPVDMRPIVKFLEESGHSQWRYLTFGFGDQMALLSRLTPATTLDGSYFTARTLPELRTSGVGLIDSAYWSTGGLAALEPILKQAGRHGVRWGFVNHNVYVPLLRTLGWARVAGLENGIQVYENPAAIRPDLSLPPAHADPLAEFSWGVLPLTAFALAALLTLKRCLPDRAGVFVPDLHAVLVGLLPIAAMFWYYFPLFVREIPGTYFTYSSVLIYLSDGLAAASIAVWLLGRALRPAVHGAAPQRNLWTWLPLIFAAYGTFSIAWSVDRPASINAALHLWIAVGLYFSLRDRPELWRPFAMGCAAALVLQAVIGFWEFGAQSTGFLTVLGLEWPGDVSPQIRGASVVALAGGIRWLRVYGSLPHPNVLGGLTLILLAGVAARFMKDGRLGLVALFGAGSGLLILTFSRSAWIGLLAAALWFGLHYQRLPRARLTRLAAAGLLGLAAFAIPLRGLILSRVGEASTAPEMLSIDSRLWTIGQSLQMLREHPLLGTGIGALAVALAIRLSPSFFVEPVHNVPLLIASELGPVGALLAGGLLVKGALSLWSARAPETIAFCGAAIAATVAALFDHFFWTLAPAQALLFAVFGICAGLLARDRAGGAA